MTFKHDFSFYHSFIYKLKITWHKIGFHDLEEDSSTHYPPFQRCKFCWASFNNYGVCVSKPKY